MQRFIVTKVANKLAIDSDLHRQVFVCIVKSVRRVARFEINGDHCYTYTNFQENCYTIIAPGKYCK